MPTLFYRDPDDGQYYPVVGGGNDHGGLFGLDDDDHPLYEKVAAKGAVNGYAGLDGSGDVYYTQLPVGTVSGKISDGAHDHVALGYRKMWASASAPLPGEGADGDVWMVYV